MTDATPALKLVSLTVCPYGLQLKTPGIPLAAYETVPVVIERSPVVFYVLRTYFFVHIPLQRIGLQEPARSGYQVLEDTVGPHDNAAGSVQDLLQCLQ